MERRSSHNTRPSDVGVGALIGSADQSAVNARCMRAPRTPPRHVLGERNCRLTDDDTKEEGPAGFTNVELERAMVRMQGVRVGRWRDPPFPE